MKSIRHKDLCRLYATVVVKTCEGERVCAPEDAKPGEIVELPATEETDTGSDYEFFKVLPDLSPSPQSESLVDRLLTPRVHEGSAAKEVRVAAVLSRLTTPAKRELAAGILNKRLSWADIRELESLITSPETWGQPPASRQIDKRSLPAGW